MDGNLVFLWMVVVIWGLGLPRAIRTARSGHPAPLIVFGLVLVLTGLMVWLWFPHAGAVSASAFALLVVIPGLLQRKLELLMGAQDYARARRVLGVLRVLHPARNVRELPPLIDALAAAQQGLVDEAEHKLTRLVEAGGKSLADQARVHLFRLRGDWHGYLDSTEGVTDAELTEDIAAISYRLRALGETGRLDALVDCYVRHASTLQAPAHTFVRLYSQLFVLAFTGQLLALERLLTGPLSYMGPTAHLYWGATCAYAAGDAPTAEAMLDILLERGTDRSLARAAQRRRLHPPQVARDVLSADSLAQLANLAVHMDHEARYGDTARNKPPRLTRALAGLNLGMFVATELSGSSEDGETLYNMGALVSGSLSVESAPRLLSAIFLHFGLLHLSMNMLALLALGPFVETTLGRWRMLAVYLSAGLTGSLLVASIPTDPPGLFLGASGCIMGLLGATAAILLHGHRTERALPAARRLWRIALVLGLQLAFDLSIPGISLTAHWSGVAVGAVVGYALVSRRRATGEARA